MQGSAVLHSTVLIFPCLAPRINLRRLGEDVLLVLDVEPIALLVLRTIIVSHRLRHFDPADLHVICQVYGSDVCLVFISIVVADPDWQMESSDLRRSLHVHP